MKLADHTHIATLAKYDLVQHIYRHRAFSRATFGPGPRVEGILNHMKKEMLEIEKNPKDLLEWVDMICLAIDGAWRAGYTPEEIAQGLFYKQGINEERKWPDWRTADPNKAIEHKRMGIKRSEDYKCYPCRDTGYIPETVDSEGPSDFEPCTHCDRGELEKLLILAGGRELTPRETWLQRVSFVYGQLDNKATREEVEARAIEMYGPCPEE